MAKAIDPELPGLVVQPNNGPVSLKPIEGREQPAVWVSKLAVFKEWPPSQETLLRQIELRRGLNILWARPSGGTGNAARLAGHGAGKTTFCRLIRFVLGEKTPGTEQFREGFRSKFSNGWVLAEVFLNGKRWLVGRPLSDTGYHPFARKDGALMDEFPKSPSRVGFADYEDALDAAVFGEMRLRTLADKGDTNPHRLAWPEVGGAHTGLPSTVTFTLTGRESAALAAKGRDKRRSAANTRVMVADAITTRPGGAARARPHAPGGA